MNQNMENYIHSGTIMVDSKKRFFTMLFGPFLLLPLNLLIGFILGGGYKIFALIMMGACLLLCLAGVVLCFKKTVVTKLLCQSFIHLHFILQLLTMQCIAFVMEFGIAVELLFFVLIPILLSIFFVLIENKKVMKDHFQFSKKTFPWETISISCSLAFLGRLIVKYFIRNSNISQNNGIILVSVLLLLLNALFACFVALNFYKIYLCRKGFLENAGDGSMSQESK